jgi:dehydrogenase/reductase SDR family member 4
VISSRNADKISKATEDLKKQNLQCHGVVCHVGKKEDRTNLIKEVKKSE